MKYSNLIGVLDFDELLDLGKGMNASFTAGLDLLFIFIIFGEGLDQAHLQRPCLEICRGTRAASRVGLYGTGRVVCCGLTVLLPCCQFCLFFWGGVRRDSPTFFIAQINQ